MTEITRENALEVIQESTQNLQRAAQSCETFEDFAEICASLRDITKASDLMNKKYSEIHAEVRFSSRTRDNLYTVESLLDVCATLFTNCYYDF